PPLRLERSRNRQRTGSIGASVLGITDVDYRTYRFLSAQDWEPATHLVVCRLTTREDERDDGQPSAGSHPTHPRYGTIESCPVGRGCPNQRCRSHVPCLPLPPESHGRNHWNCIQSAPHFHSCRTGSDGS